jgi:hypothetical protein
MSKLITINYEDIMAYEYSYSIPSQYSQLRSYAKRTIDYDLPYYGYFKTTKNYVASSREYYQLRNSFSTNSASENLYPIAVRHVTKDNIYVIERPPFQLEVDFRLGSANSQAPKMYPLKIWIPWTVMLIKLDSFTSGSLSSVRLYFNDSPISSLDDVLFSPWLPNAYSNGGICFSNSMDDFAHVLDNDRISSNDINYIYNYIFNNYMMGGWNCDLALNFEYLSLFHRIGVDDSAKYPSNHSYTFPDKDMINKVVSTIVDDPDATKLITKAMKSKRTMNNYNNYASGYTKHLATLAAFDLEQTLSLMSEIKAHYAEVSSLNNNYQIAKLNGYRLSSRIESFRSNYPHDDSYFFNAFYRNVFASMSSTKIPYEVSSNYIYIDTHNNEIPSNYKSYNDLYVLIGQNNLPAFHTFMNSLFEAGVQNKIVHISFDDLQDEPVAKFTLLDNVTISDLIEPHKQALKDYNQNNNLPSNSTTNMYKEHFSYFEHNTDYFERW